MLLIVVIPLTFLAKNLAALVSRIDRDFIRYHKMAYAAWGVLSVICIVMIVGAVGAVHVTKHSKTPSEMIQFLTACQNYQVEYSIPPDGRTNATLVQQLETNNPRHTVFFSPSSSNVSAEGEFLDEWKTPFRVFFTASGKLAIHSAGHDRKWDTADDLSSDHL